MNIYSSRTNDYSARVKFVYFNLGALSIVHEIFVPISKPKGIKYVRRSAITNAKEQCRQIPKCIKFLLEQL